MKRPNVDLASMLHYQSLELLQRKDSLPILQGHLAVAPGVRENDVVGHFPEKCLNTERPDVEEAHGNRQSEPCADAAVLILLISLCRRFHFCRQDSA